jgi:oxidase EvaA
MNEKVRIAESASDLRCFLEETIIRSDFKLQRIKLSEQSLWSIKNGALSHFSNGFFHVTGIRNRITNEEHLILFQPQSALTGLAMFRDGQQVTLLLQARIEPGLSNVGQYGPTIQSTAANYLQMHGGKRTSYIDLFRSFSPIANTLGNNIQFDLGKRYFQKNKVHSYLELNEQIETKENMIWVPLQVVAEVLTSDNFLNPDLRSLLTVFDWDLFVNADISSNRKTQVPENNHFSLPANLLGKNEWKLIALDQLTGWEIQDNGITDVSDSGIWVDMHHVSCFSREVQEWSQPLLSCSNRGLVVLLVRRIDDHFEFLISIESEFGISGERTVLPSFVIYPGDNPENMSGLFESETLIAEMTQSEEGGRFYKNESIYRVILIADNIEPKPHQKWVTAETLKSILKSSSSASLQLRCIASLVLDVINPDSFD